MSKVRAFLAVTASPSVIAEAERVIAKLARVEGPVVKWCDPEQLHITLKFFGDVAHEATSDICRVTSQVTQSWPAFSVECVGLGAFPALDRPRTLWAGLGQGAGDMVALAHGLEEALQPLGYPSERRRFHPHVTLGRVRGRGSARALSERVGEYQSHPLGVVPVDEVVLFSSERGPSGPVYQRMATLPLS